MGKFFKEITRPFKQAAHVVVHRDNSNHMRLLGVKIGKDLEPVVKVGLVAAAVATAQPELVAAGMLPAAATMTATVATNTAIDASMGVKGKDLVKGAVISAASGGVGVGVVASTASTAIGQAAITAGGNATIAATTGGNPLAAATGFIAGTVVGNNVGDNKMVSGALASATNGTVKAVVSGEDHILRTALTSAGSNVVDQSVTRVVADLKADKVEVKQKVYIDNEYVEEPVMKPIKKPVDKPIEKPINEPIKKSIDELVKESTDKQISDIGLKAKLMAGSNTGLTISNDTDNVTIKKNDLQFTRKLAIDSVNSASLGVAHNGVSVGSSDSEGRSSETRVGKSDVYDNGFFVKYKQTQEKGENRDNIKIINNSANFEVTNFSNACFTDKSRTTIEADSTIVSTKVEKELHINNECVKGAAGGAAVIMMMSNPITGLGGVAITSSL
jgi:hypothetical protein